MSHLMYNLAEDKLTTRNELSLIDTPIGRGRFHKPYPFDTYVNEIEHQLNRNGIKIANQEYVVTNDNDTMFGMMELEPIEGELITAKDWGLNMAVRASHSQKVARGLALGNRVMVCSNLCFNGDLGTFHTKQTLNISQRLPGLIYDAVSRIPELAHNQEKKFDQYKNTELKNRWGDAALIELLRRGAFTGSQINRALNQWDNPDYEEHAAYGRSVWQLFNASTEALKPTGNNVNMLTVENRSKIISGFMDEIAGCSF